MRRLSILLGILLSQAFISAGAQNYSFIELPAENGLSSTVNSIYIDDFGFGYLGTDHGLVILECNGLSTLLRKDGSTGMSDVLPSDIVLKVFKDSRGFVWVLTDKGFYGFNSTPGRISEIIRGMDGLTPVYSVVEIDGTLYFGGENMIVSYSHRTGEFSTILKMNETPPVKFMNLLHGFGIDGVGDDIIAVDESVNYMLYDIRTKNLRKSRFLQGTSRTFISSYIDSRGRLWLSSIDDGVFCVNSNGEGVSHYTTANGLSSEVVSCFLEKGGQMWMGTDGGGINILDMATDEITIIRHDPLDPGSIPAGAINGMFCDQNGHIWCQRPTGGVFIICQPQIKTYATESIQPHISPDGICSFFQDPKSGMILLGTRGSGLLTFDTSSKAFRQYPTTNGLYIYSIARMSPSEIIMFCPGRGFRIFNKDNGTITRPNIPRGAFSNYYRSSDGVSMGNDRYGRIILALDGIGCYDPSTSSFSKYDKDGIDLRGNLKIVSGSDCQYFIDNNSLYKWDETKSSRLQLVHTFETASTLTSGAMSPDGIAWITDDNNLMSYNTRTDEAGINSFDDNISISSVLCDRAGRVWMSTNRGVYLHDRNSGSMKAIGEVEGVTINVFSPSAKFVSSSGDIYFGGTEGFVHIPSYFQVSKSADPQVGLFTFKVDGKNLLPEPSRKIVVPSDHNSVDINIFANTQDILARHLFRLTWDSGKGDSIEKVTDNQHVHFYKIPPGKYALKASCTTEDGKWIDPVEICSVVVRRPWYKAWWLFSLLAFAVIANIIYLLVRSYRKKNLELSLEKEKETERYNFMVNVSHELRTPLTLIVGPLTRMLKSSSLSDKDQETVSRVCQQANRITNLLSTVLTTTKIQEGAMVAKPVPTELNAWHRKLAEEFRDEADGHNMKLVIRQDPTIGTLDMDHELCRIVFYNMMTNAIKHNEPGHHITTLTEWNNDNGMVRISIRDHGSGIGDIDVSQLFEKYYRATEEVTGFGIGLTYSKEIVEAHNGIIGAYNNHGDKGATFWFELPAGKDTRIEAGSGNGAGIEGRTMADMKKLKDKTILFVDDDKDLREYVCQEMAEFCDHMLTAFNGRNALDVLAANNVDVIITDVMMPDIDGVELCRRVKQDTRFNSIPVIMLTAKADKKSEEKGYAAKADFYMPKPFEVDRLISILDSKID